MDGRNLGLVPRMWGDWEWEKHEYYPTATSTTHFNRKYPKDWTK